MRFRPSKVGAAPAQEGGEAVPQSETEGEAPPVAQPHRWLAECGDAVLSVAYSPDGMQLATGDDSKTLTVWAAATGEKLREVECGGLVWSVAYSPDGAQLATGDRSNTLTVWNAACDPYHVAFASLPPMCSAVALGTSLLPLHMLLAAVPGSRRTFATHAAAEGNVDYLQCAPRVSKSHSPSRHTQQ